MIGVRPGLIPHENYTHHPHCAPEAFSELFNKLPNDIQTSKNPSEVMTKFLKIVILTRKLVTAHGLLLAFLIADLDRCY